MTQAKEAAEMQLKLKLILVNKFTDSVTGAKI